MKIKCCKNCIPPKRHKDCHSTCKDYKEEKQQLEEENELIRANKNCVYADYEHDKIVKYAHNKHLKKRR